MENRLYILWSKLLSKYTDDNLLLENHWEEVKGYYSEQKRYYHNLNHISYMLHLAENDQAELDDYDTLQFAIWYHDIIYNSTKSNNELKSAIVAQKQLKHLQIDLKKIENCANLIVSTKKHEIHKNVRKSMKNIKIYKLDIFKSSKLPKLKAHIFDVIKGINNILQKNKKQTFHVRK